MARTIQSISIIVEWENAERIGAERARRMLGELHRQLAALEPGPGQREVIFVYRRGESDEEAGRVLRKAVAEHGRVWPASLLYLPVDTGDYYQQKNRGAEAASGDLLLFLDSDVILSPHWLERMIESFEDRAVSVVGGAVEVETAGLYSKAMALGWFFASPDGSALSPSPGFFANNVAFRREAFEPFPETGQYRGQCLALAAALKRSGWAIHVQPGARVGHPPPEGLNAFLLRALWDGHDSALSARRSARSPWIRGIGSMAKTVVQRSARVWRRRSTVDLGAAGAAAAVAIVAAYHLLAVAGLAATAAAPAAMRRALRRWDSALASQPKARSSPAAGRTRRAEGR